MATIQIDFTKLKLLIKKYTELKLIISEYSDDTLSETILLNLKSDLQSVDLLLKSEIDLIKTSLKLTQEPSLIKITSDCITKRTELVILQTTINNKTLSAIDNSYESIKIRLTNIQTDFDSLILKIDELGYLKAIREFIILIQPLNIVLFPITPPPVTP